MTHAPAPLQGPALWDHLRTESLNYYDNADAWPESTTLEELQAHIAAAAATIFAAVHSTHTSSTATSITGVLHTRWAMLDNTLTATLVVNHTPYLGEMTLTFMTARIPAILHLNTFVAQWAPDWVPPIVV